MTENFDPRKRFFNESGSMIPPFVDPSWRGCALYRDFYDNTSMPKELFAAIVAAAKSHELLISRYMPDSERPDVLAANWEAFCTYAYNRDNWSLEYVLFDTSESWALLADADATVLGATPALADQIDWELSKVSTSLKGLTDTSFPGLDPTTQPGAAYLLAVSGR
jgi:hypothetical protein